MSQFPQHAGGVPTGYDVTVTGTKLYEPLKAAKLVVITNASDTPMYLAICGAPGNTVNTAVVSSGIYIQKNGGAYELNLVNMGQAQIWAIHSGVGVKRACVQVCS